MEALYVTVPKMVEIVELVWEALNLKPNHKKAKEIVAAIVFSILMALGQENVNPAIVICYHVGRSVTTLKEK